MLATTRQIVQTTGAVDAVSEVLETFDCLCKSLQRVTFMTPRRIVVRSWSQSEFSVSMLPHDQPAAAILKPPAWGSQESGEDPLLESSVILGTKKENVYRPSQPGLMSLSTRSTFSEPLNASSPEEKGDAEEPPRCRWGRDAISTGVLLFIGMVAAIYAGLCLGGKVSNSSRSILMPPREVGEAAAALPPLGSSNVAKASARKPPFLTKSVSASSPVEDSEQGNNAVTVPVVGEGRKFPALGESTVMFLHIFKCAGSTLRRMLVDWAGEEGSSGAIVVKCDDPKQYGTVCVKHYELVDEDVQRAYMAHQKVLAGHFLWGFQRHVKTPYLMVTAIRNPLELFVSGQQYLHKKETKTLQNAQRFASEVMVKILKSGGNGAAPGTWTQVSESDIDDGYLPNQVTGFIRRLVGVDRRLLYGESLEQAAIDAIENLENFWVVGVVEQYSGFEEVLKSLLDPEGKHDELWQKYAKERYNTSRFKSSEVLEKIDDDLIRQFNATLTLQWKVYEKAVELWDVRCREVLPASKHERLCTVPTPPERY